MMALLTAVLVASLLGSLHCAGMCGGLVAFYSGHGAKGTRHLPHLAYSVGRLVSYSLLGALAGAVGASVDLAGSFAGLQRTAAIVAGALILVWGLVGLRRGSVTSLGSGWVPVGVKRLVSGAMGRLRSSSAVARASTLGVLSALLPCGWLYAFAICAAGTGHPGLGAAVMAVFWLGTVPVLVGLGYGAQSLSQAFRERVPALSAVVLIVIGVLTVFGRVDGVGLSPDLSAPATQGGTVSAGQVLDEIEELEGDDLPCCSHD